jgi:hypothetical protein
MRLAGKRRMTPSPRAGRVLLALLLAAGIAGCSLRAPEATGSGAGRTPLPDRDDRPPPAVVAPVAPMPARLVTDLAAGGGPSNQCLAEIEAFAERHTGNRVMLGQAAFADSDRLVLARMPRRGSDGLPLDGRAAMPQPVVLNLLRDATGCSVRVAPPSSDAANSANPAAAAVGAGADGAPLPGCRCVSLQR